MRKSTKLLMAFLITSIITTNIMLIKNTPSICPINSGVMLFFSFACVVVYMCYNNIKATRLQIAECESHLGGSHVRNARHSLTNLCKLSLARLKHDSANPHTA